MLQKEYDKVNKRLSNLKKKRKEFEDKLKVTYSRDDIIEYKFQIAKIDEKIPRLEQKIHILSIKVDEERKRKLKKENEERERKLKEEKEKAKREAEKKKKELLYKELYVELNNEDLSLIKKLFGLTHLSNNKLINYLANNNYKKTVIVRLNNTLKILNSSERDNFIKTIKNQNINLNEFRRYEKLITTDKLDSYIKNIINRVEEETEVYFSRIANGKIEFHTDISLSDYDFGYDFEEEEGVLDLDDVGDYATELREEIDEIVEGYFVYILYDDFTRDYI